MEHIDVIFYINLAHRTDRRAHIEKELLNLCNEPSKIIRIEAEYVKENGALGCALSHLNALKKFNDNPEWNTCIIFEDDFKFIHSDISENNAKLRGIIGKYPDWNAISLTYTPESLFFEKLEGDNDIIKIFAHSSTAGYMLNKGKISEQLMNCFSKCAFNLKKLNLDVGVLNIDKAWNTIQKKYNWYSNLFPLGRVIDGYSDICQKDVYYNVWENYK